MKVRKRPTLWARLLGKTNPADYAGELPFVQHLVELRDRLLRAIVVVLVVFICLTPFANKLYTQLAHPLMASLPQGTTMVATEIASTFFTPFKFTFVFAVFLCIPMLLYQMWAFIAPGLYDREKRIALPLLVASSFLFYLGVMFAYFVIFPVMFTFLANSAPQGVTVMPDITHYLDLVTKLFFAFGAVFEVPVATMLMIWTGVSTVEDLRKKRPYLVVAAFIVGAVFTPPDILSQFLLAVPMILLFEAGLLASQYLIKPRGGEAAAESHSDDGDHPHHSNPS